MRYVLVYICIDIFLQQFIESLHRILSNAILLHESQLDNEIFSSIGAVVHTCFYIEHRD